jgi:predicted SAM-dependent methyltransferase
MERKLNLGCGNDIRPKSEGWDNVDSINLPNVDIVLNLDYSNWPIKDNTYDYIECKMVLEHLRNWPQAMEEIWRIAKPGAKIYIEVPFFPSMYSVIDPTHKSFFAYQTFEYFTPENALNYYTKARFKILKRYIRFSWNKILNLLAIPINLFPIFYSRYWAFIFPSNSLEIKLEVIK